MRELSGIVKSPSGERFEIIIRPQPSTPRQNERKRYGQYTRQLLLTHQDHRCAICRGPLSLHEAHVDHIIPLSGGGSDEFANLQLVHMNCNLRKGRKANGPQERMPWAA